MTEEWRDCYWHPGEFEVSSDGRVRRKRDGFLFKTNHPCRITGYCKVRLQAESGEIKMLLVHRLVAFAFCGEPKEGQQVHHKNGIKTDNRVSNLEWVDARDHGGKEAERRKVQGIKTKAHENWLARKNMDFDNMAHIVP